MAEPGRLGNHDSATKSTNNQDENFCLFNVLCVFISLVTILADFTTDILVFAEYCKNTQLLWALSTLIFILTPNILINIFSLRWFIIDQKSNIRLWITHGCLVGLLERYATFLYKVFSCKNLESVKTQKLISQRNDLSLLHFLYIFMGTIPQIILQTYAIVTLDENYYTKAFALTASIASVIWGCAAYVYSITAFGIINFDWSSLILKLIWHFGMLISRIAGIFLFTIIFGIWTLLPIGLHWTAMTFWILSQKTNFCPNKLEETLYNVVMGYVYCFCYINLREGHTRYRLIIFYTLIVTQNFSSLILYLFISDTEKQRKHWSIAAITSLVVGTIIGICAMIIYYRYFHVNGPITWKNAINDTELNNKTSRVEKDSNKNFNYIRSFKNTQENRTFEMEASNESSPPVQAIPNEAESADKRFLLDHWMARSGTPFTSAPVGSNSMDVSSIEFHTVENTPQSINIQREDQSFNGTNKLNTKLKKKTICSPTQLTLKLSCLDNLESSIDEITSSNLNLQKRRCICSSDELRHGLTNLDVCKIINENFNKTIKADHSSEISQDTDSSNKKTSSDSIDMDLDLSFSDINSSDINTFNENIVQKLCLSALKNIKVGNQDADIENIQRIALDILKEMYAKKGKAKKGTVSTFPYKQRDLDTPTEMLSVHDYENICAVNIAREAWGLRSWNGYCDIENWLHDGSVVRDRQCDTLTSGSSEISSCISQDLKNAMLAAPPFPKKAPTYSNVFVKFDRSNQEDYIDTVLDESFLAKPCVVDNGKDLNHLEPIMEELDDLGDTELANKKRLNSESSLVATIDEIRKATMSNSPKNLYHRISRNCLEFTEPNKTETDLKRTLWKEPYKVNFSNIMDTLSEKENILNASHDLKYDSNKKGLNITVTSSTDISETVSGDNKNGQRRQKSSSPSTKVQHKKNNHSQEQFQDLSNKDIDFLWQLVSETSLPVSSTEDLSSSRITSSLQSLIQKESSLVVNTSSSKILNVKKGSRNRPRRKFSILRERFEPKINTNSDEEILYHCSENISQSNNPNIVNVKNQLDANNGKQISPTRNKFQENIGIKPNNLMPVLNDTVSPKNIKDKRSLFMKQVLSPPKFNTKLKHKI